MTKLSCWTQQQLLRMPIRERLLLSGLSGCVSCVCVVCVCDGWCYWLLNRLLTTLCWLFTLFAHSPCLLDVVRREEKAKGVVDRSSTVIAKEPEGTIFFIFSPFLICILLISQSLPHTHTITWDWTSHTEIIDWLEWKTNGVGNFGTRVDFRKRKL